jgi:Zn-dependent protease
MQTDPLFLIIEAVVIIFSIIVHEVAHGVMANFLGDPTARLEGRLTLNPVPHIDPVGSIIVPLLTVFGGGFMFGWAKPVPYNPRNLKNQQWGEALVAAAGPLSNLIIAGFFGTLIRFAGNLGLASTSFYTVAGMIVVSNIVLAVFNLVPIPPLDGSKVLFSLLPYHIRHNEFFTFLERYGLVLALFFAFFLFQTLHPVIELIFQFFTGSSF